MTFKLVWLFAFVGASGSTLGVDDRRLLNLGIRESCGDVGVSLAVLAKGALAPENTKVLNENHKLSTK